MAALNAFLEALTDANMTQEGKRTSAPLTTKERHLTANRNLKSIVLIAGAGMLAFADDPPTLASFEALMASTKKTAKPKMVKPKMAAPDVKKPPAPLPRRAEPRPLSGCQPPPLRVMSRASAAGEP